MSSADGARIEAALAGVRGERAQRAADVHLAESVAAVKAYQHGRFRLTYADLLASPRYAQAAGFFLEDLYGPRDFSARDEQFGRIVPALVRLFPGEIVATVAELGELHALSERLDTAMGRCHLALGAGDMRHETIDGPRYGALWRATAQPAARERQIALMVSVGEALDRFTRRTLLRHTLRLMRGPAQAAGLGELQAFLERGFDTFRAMRGAEAFLEQIAQRERSLAGELFAGAEGPAVSVR
jgi:hypothetical protein